MAQCEYCGYEDCDGHPKGCPGANPAALDEWERGRHDAKLGLEPQSNDSSYRIGHFRGGQEQ